MRLLVSIGGFPFYVFDNKQESREHIADFFVISRIVKEGPRFHFPIRARRLSLAV